MENGAVSSRNVRYASDARVSTRNSPMCSMALPSLRSQELKSQLSQILNGKLSYQHSYNNVIRENQEICKRITTHFHKTPINHVSLLNLLKNNNLLSQDLEEYLTDTISLDMMVIPIKCYSITLNQQLYDCSSLLEMIQKGPPSQYIEDPKTRENISKIELDATLLKLINKLLTNLQAILIPPIKISTSPKLSSKAVLSPHPIKKTIQWNDIDIDRLINRLILFNSPDTPVRKAMLDAQIHDLMKVAFNTSSKIKALGQHLLKNDVLSKKRYDRIFSSNYPLEELPSKLYRDYVRLHWTDFNMLIRAIIDIMNPHHDSSLSISDSSSFHLQS